MSYGPATHSGVVARLFREGYLFDFFQAVRLLEGSFAGGQGPGEKADVAEELVRFRPYHGLVFPATDVKSIELSKDTPQHVIMTVTFMGLYGVGSPLPVYFYDSIATDQEESKPLRDFLDIFNHRLYSLFYRSWKKYRLLVQYSGASTRDDLIALALSLAGLGTKGAADASVLPSIRLAAFAGALSLRVRNSEGLRNLLSEFLGGVEVGIAENVPRWVTIRQRARIGGRNGVKAALGSTACIGNQVYDVSGKFRVVLGPLTFVEYQQLLPGGESARLLQFLAHMYVRDYLHYDVQLKLRTSEIPPQILGDRTSRLGLTSWLGTPQGETASRIVTYN